ncbi:IS1182 family transposase [Dietzia kunjamensis]|uniref:IS1182 family transposase n=1 Tax=Dietzia kunjamensis TaxID=322509 RepID=UPI0024B8C4E9|nr:IS1182 family transposase [Dietzia kunjamensis]MBB0993035.1 IS1182 family transposase [Dietzia sp. SLG510A3-40A3]MBB1008931.1 IS1182 family transposase [Dietzia sp. SLG510A3-3B2-2]MDJ0420948.1 IS1182 family transposase [Dietzia kunjamensis]
MQGESDRQRELLDVESVAGHLLEEGSVFALLAEHRDRLFPDELFADLFPSGRGRPSIPGEVIASVIVLQALFGHSDREAVDALTFDLRWKAACGYPVDAKGFNSSTLTYWRRRLAASDRPQRIFEVVRQVIAETGAVKAKTRRALDSTVLDDAVARQDTITQLIASECTRLAATCGHDYSEAGKPRIAWDDQGARDELVSALVADALALLGALDVEAITAAGGKPAEAVALLALVAGQDVEPAEDSDGTDGRWRIARRTAPDRVISTVDPDARHAHKTRQRRQDGFKAHIVVEPDTGLTTMCSLTKPNGPTNSDAAVGAALVTADPTIGVGEPVEVLGDSAYASGDMLHTLAGKQWLPLVKPWPLRPAVEGGFTLDDFTFDAVAGTLTCPAKFTRGLSAKGNATFGAACRGCPLRQRCTTSTAGRKVVLGEHHLLQRQHRQRAGDEDFQTVYRQHRPMVERSIAWLTRGARRVPYRGVEKNNNWLHHRVAALNLRRLLAMGLTSQNGTWALA